ncbi:MAG: glycosyl hydrolase family 5 [Candidatus Brocadiia bacterium]
MRSRPIAPFVLLACMGVAGAAAWEVAPTDDAAVVVRCRHAPVVQAHYVFWGPEWKWAGARTALTEAGPEGYAFEGTVERLGLTLRGTLSKPSPNVLKFTYILDAAQPLKGIIGGGLEWRLVLDSPALGRGAAEPVLLEGDRGWRWPVGEGRAVSVVFEPAAAKVYFERGNKAQIRTFLVGEALAQGRTTVAMTVSLPEGGVVARPLLERYGGQDTEGWVPDALRWDAAPVDLAFLNHRPAGKHGFVRAEGDRLVFEDGTPARFWGGNIAAYAIFADKDHIARHARRIAQLGYNLMRIHHHDSMRWVSPTAIDKSRDDSQHLDPQAMDRLDWWIKCLKDQGVYVWLDLHVGRVLKDGDGVAPGWAEIKRRGGSLKGFCYFNPSIQELMKDFNRKYLAHKNPYTGLAYKDDPAIMGLLVTNENDLTHHFGNLMLPDKNNPVHNGIFEKAVRAFCARTGLPYDPTWRTWEDGPSKIFLAQREHLFNANLLGHLAETGARVPAATTNTWGRMGLCGLPSLADGGLIDAHAYGEAEFLSLNPRAQASFIHWLAAAQVHGKPLSISEWNVPHPHRDRFAAPLYVASVAALQGWDAPMVYNYSQRPFGKPGRPYRWSTFSDPAITAVMPAAAIAFRRRHVQPARTTVCLQLDRQQLYYQGLDPTNAAAIRTLAERSRLTIGLSDVEELEWDRQTRPGEAAVVLTDPHKDAIPPGQSFVASDTGELRRDWARGVQTIDTARTQAAQGWLGGEDIELSTVRFRIATPKAVVAVTSLDGRPLAASRRLLVTTVARAVAPEGRMPFLSEPVRGTLEVKSEIDDMELVPKAPDGSDLPPVAPRRADGAYALALPAGQGTHWYELRAPAR